MYIYIYMIFLYSLSVEIVIKNHYRTNVYEARIVVVREKFAIAS